MRRLTYLVVGIVGLAVVICGGWSAAMALPAMCYQGTFAADNTVTTHNFNVTTGGFYELQTWSYAGGTDPCGNLVPRGGFDPILSLFSGAGVNLMASNDDGWKRLDSANGLGWDSYIKIYLAPGNYTVALTEYDNFAVGPGLGNGFLEDGNANFTAGYSPPYCTLGVFCDVSGTPFAQRTALYDYSIQAVPEPGSLLLLGTGVLGLAGIIRRKLF